MSLSTLVMNLTTPLTSKFTIDILPEFWNLCSAAATCSGESMPTAGIVTYTLCLKTKMHDRSRKGKRENNPVPREIDHISIHMQAQSITHDTKAGKKPSEPRRGLPSSCPPPQPSPVAPPKDRRT